jgi:uncharacterized protein (TIGR03790 family)
MDLICKSRILATLFFALVFSCYGASPAFSSIWFTDPDTVAVIVKARADITTNAPGIPDAKMTLRINGVIVGTKYVSDTSSFNEYGFIVDSIPAMAKIDVVFTNDAVINGQDRNLYVESITTADQSFTMLAAEAQYDKGSGDAAFDGVDVVPGQTSMPVNGALRFSVPPTPGVDIVVRATGSMAGNVWPVMVARVNGIVVGSKAVKSNSFQNYIFKVTSVPAGSKIDISFVNSGLVDGRFRILYIQSVKVHDQLMLPGSARYDRGSGNAAFDGINVVPGQMSMPENGALRFIWSSAPAKILTVRAKASLAANVGAMMTIRVDNVAVATKEIRSTAYQNYDFTTTSIPPTAKIDVVFTNDVIINGQDRNLYVESITANDQTLAAAKAQFDRGSGNAAFDGIDVRVGQAALSWNGALRFTLSPLSSAIDSDFDGVPNTVDNCTLVINARQQDSDGDGFGNACDGDLNNDNIVDAKDADFLKANYGSPKETAKFLDLNSDGVINNLDLAILQSRTGKAPGPKALLTSSGLVAAQMGLIINDDDPYSVAIGEYYRVKRGIPAANIVHVKIPVQASLTLAQFKPLKQKIDQTLPPYVQAIAVAWTTPYKVECNSITSAISRDFMPEPCSPNASLGTCLFATKNPYERKVDTPLPYARYGFRPSMLLAAKTQAEGKALIDRGFNAKGRKPSGSAYIMKTSDGIRSSRATDYYADFLGDSLSPYVNAKIVSANSIKNTVDALFYFQGLATVPDIATNAYPAGAVADNLTSYGGVLTASSGQTSILDFISAGVTGSFGTVTEPCAYREKFPDIRMVIENYAAGQTLVEAYWKSVSQTFQGLFVGDPLANPWELVRSSP